MNSYQSAFIANLKYYRDKKGISQARLAELCNCGTGTIGSIESARQNPSFDLLYRIADILEIHPADLFLRGASTTVSESKSHIERVLTERIHELLETEFSS